MIENTILKKNKEGKKANVFGLTFPSLELVELAAHAGFDAINCDGEHGLFSPEAIDNIVKSLNEGEQEQVLLGVTGSGKTFTMAKVLRKSKNQH